MRKEGREEPRCLRLRSGGLPFLGACTHDVRKIFAFSDPYSLVTTTFTELDCTIVPFWGTPTIADVIRTSPLFPARSYPLEPLQSGRERAVGGREGDLGLLSPRQFLVEVRISGRSHGCISSSEECSGNPLPRLSTRRRGKAVASERECGRRLAWATTVDSSPLSDLGLVPFGISRGFHL